MTGGKDVTEDPETRLDIRFIASGSSSAISEALGALIGFTVDLDVKNDGYPSKNVHVLRVDGDGDLVICETDDRGIPIDNSTWAVPQFEIRRVTVPLGDKA